MALAVCAPARGDACWLAVGGQGLAPKAAFRAEYLDPSGRRRVLAVTDASPAGGEAQVKLPVPASAVAWAGLIPRSLADKLAGGVLLQGPETAGAFRPEEVIPLVEETDVQPAPLETNLLPGLQATPFGREERVSARMANGRLVVETKPGTAPAGVVLRPDRWYLPERAPLTLQIAWAGAGEHRWAISDADRARREAPLSLAAGGARGPLAPLQVAVPGAGEGLDRRSWAGLTLVCPTSGGRAEITSLALSTRGTRTTERALWAWQPALWLDTPDDLTARLGRYAAGTVFITVPLTDAGDKVRQPAELAAFVRRMSGAKALVWAVAGDPHAVLPAERPKFVRMARAYDAYNKSVAPEERLAGVQYDIEPYTLPGYQLDADAWNQAYLETIRALKEASSLPLEVVLPFWSAQATAGGRPLLDGLAECVDSVAVMDYRTDPALIGQFAVPFLDWGVKRSRPVRIALEAGPIADEARRHYRPAPAGELWLTRAGTQDVVVLLKHPARCPAGAAFAQTRVSTFQGATLSFHGRDETLRALLPALESGFAAWPSFAGLALHGVE